jgi:hypothetical protein
MLQLEMHPDRGGDHWNAALINEAYAVLSDARRREEYDRRFLSTPSRCGFRRNASGAEVAGREKRDRPTVSLVESSSGDRCVFCQAPCTAGAAEDPYRSCGVCYSPLYPADRLRALASGNRSTARVERRREVRLYTDWPQPEPFRGMLEDVSPRGLRLSTQKGLADYQIVKIDAGELQAVGRVANRRPKRDGRDVLWSTGIEFFTVLVRPGFFITRCV